MGVVELHPVFSVHVILDELRNVDLTARGYYQIRLIPKSTSQFTSVDIQCAESTSTSSHSSSFILPPSVRHGAGISKTVEITYVDEILTVGDTFIITLRLDARADLEIEYCFVLDVELWCMDRHRPPNFDSFELASRRTTEISICPYRLTAASRQIFFEHSTYAALTLSVYASLVSVLPRRKRHPPDEADDIAKSRQIHLSTAYILMQAIDSIERFVVRNVEKMVTSVRFDRRDIEAEMESLKSRLKLAEDPYKELEVMAVNLSSRLSLNYNQLIRLCSESPGISASLLQCYRNFRTKMLAELFFYNENSFYDLHMFTPLNKMISLILKSKYLEKLPRFPIFCADLDDCVNNWSLILEDRFVVKSSPCSVIEENFRIVKAETPNIKSISDDIKPVRRRSYSAISSCFPWRKHNLNRSQSSGSLALIVGNRVVQSFSNDRQSVYSPDDDFSTIIDFITARERLKADFRDQNLFDGYFYSEQASLRSPFTITNADQPKHLVVFVHGLDGTCDDLSSYRNVFRVVTGYSKGFCYLLSEANHAKTWSDIDSMAQNLLSEVQSHIAELREPPSHISFVAHSLGGVIVRAAVCRKEAEEWLIPRLHTLLTINSPHLGLAYVGRGVNLGMQFMQWWKQSLSIKQLSLKDKLMLSESFLFRLSRKKTFGLFRNVLLVGTCGDTFVPFHSALLIPCKTAMKDPSALGTTYSRVRQVDIEEHLWPSTHRLENLQFFSSSRKD
ncbi:hypothetical protein KIN20_005470 [Parelaphostrongylus tenuis]|uniref:DUF676 domain-containing protein n=1 Tax=Parelaphostrongylus tenuis TaxID=148309 RepID=A0AAD5M4K0_PARTN|nr:hypothetical protein KIN20_005470 [Parelaphostrongylus tenuis]